MRGVPRITLAPRERRALTSGAIAIALTLGLSRGVPAWLAWHRNAREAASETTSAVSRAEWMIGAQRQVSESLTVRSERLSALERELLGGDSPAAAAATLASFVSQAAASSGVELGAVQVQSDSSVGSSFARVSVRGNGTGDLRGIMNLILDIEKSRQLAIRDLAISATDVAAAGDRPEVLRVEFLVQGLANPGMQPAKASR